MVKAFYQDLKPLERIFSVKEFDMESEASDTRQVSDRPTEEDLAESLLENMTSSPGC